MNLPFKEQIKEGYYIRTFSEDISEMELKWHFDEEDRIVLCEDESDWFFQFDNELPIQFKKNKSLMIPKNRYHRIIKGTNNLKLKIKKL
jgi:hypothetical protein